MFSDGKPRFIQIKDINLDADVGAHMVYITNTDVPGMIGFIGTTFGNAGVNIANFQLGRKEQGSDAIALLYVDGPVPEELLETLRANPAIRHAKPIAFQRRLRRARSGASVSGAPVSRPPSGAPSRRWRCRRAPAPAR